ncbi:MAG: hypothetical protein JNM93_08270 [Bacteriovoracaceae bacterium]|nr:hypothetical protein [Bacteriovoracaceae bacterium]
MKNLKNKKIIIFNDSPIQSKDLKKHLELENSGQIFIADTIESLEKILAHHNIDLVLAEFTMPKTHKHRIQKYLKKMSKYPVNYLIVNTRIITSKNKKDEDSDLYIFSQKMIENTDTVTVDENPEHDISENIKELYHQELSLNIMSDNKSLAAEFLELHHDGLLLALKEKLNLEQEYCFTLKNFLNEANEYILYGTVKDVQNNTFEKKGEGFLIYIEIRSENQKHWDELLKKIQVKQKEAINFIKKANGR